MFCPRCGSSQSEDLKFCKVCGTNLASVKQAVVSPETAEKFDWKKTWVAEMMRSGEEHARRQEAIDRQRGITPEVKLRYQEIKGGVITSSVGIGIAIFLAVFMDGLVASGKVGPDTAQILRSLWIAGVIPLFVGIALIINGLIVSKRLVEIANSSDKTGPRGLSAGQTPRSLNAADTNEFIDSPFSVTEHTTKHLSTSGEKQ
jgi:hypothetical protein